MPTWKRFSEGAAQRAQERYLTAERLADDLRAYLDGQPVGARRGTARYRIGKFIRRHRWTLAAAAVLLVTLLVGVAGVAWQAQVANEERRKAEARSTDLRQLSNSFQLELDEAIKQLPGTTGAQKLLVTRVIEHLDHMANDAHGDRQTQLDLVEAYTRLGNLQGNAYDQNLGDATGALASIDKAIALGTPWASRDSKDREALHALANAQLSRGQVLFGTAPIQQSISATQAAIANYQRLIDLPGATPEEMCEAAAAYSTLGDELGVVITESLNDLAGANSAYRKELELYDRALSINPNLMSAKRGQASTLLDIIPTEKESDPQQGLKDIQLGLQRIAALPIEERKSLRMIRIRESFLVDEAFVLAQMGSYTEANPIAIEPVQSAMRRAAADPQDSRALGDVLFTLDRQAGNLDIAADPALDASIQDRRHYLSAEEKSLIQERAGLERMVVLNPSQKEWKPVLGDVEVRLGSVQSKLHNRADAAELVSKGLAALKESIKEDQNSPEILDTTAKDLMIEKTGIAAISTIGRFVCRTGSSSNSSKDAVSAADAGPGLYCAVGQIEKSREQ